MSILLTTFLQKDICKDRVIQLYCTNGELEDPLDTGRYVVKAYGKEAALSCPIPIYENCFYIEVEKIPVSEVVI